MIRVEASMFWMEKRCDYFLIAVSLDTQRLTFPSACSVVKRLKLSRKIYF